jgi:hypothetical protein
MQRRILHTQWMMCEELSKQEQNLSKRQEQNLSKRKQDVESRGAGNGARR